MKSRYTPVCMLALSLAACSTAPTALQSVQPEPTSKQAPTYRTQAVSADFNFATANSAALSTNSLPWGSAPGHAIDDGTFSTAWRSAPTPRDATLTVALDAPKALSRITLYVNELATAGRSVDIQTSVNGRTWRTIKRRATSVPMDVVPVGSVTQSIIRFDALAALGTTVNAKFIRLNFHNPTLLSARSNFVVSHIEVEGANITPTNAMVPRFSWLDLFSAVPQYRPDKGRLRFETSGLATDPPQITLNEVGFDLLSEEPTLRITGSARMLIDGRRTLLLSNIPLERVVDEPGIVFGGDATDEIELIWPELGGDPPGNAIVRIQDGNFFRTNAELVEATFTLQAWSLKTGQLVYQWNGRPPETLAGEPRLDN